MFGIPSADIIPVANFIGLGILGILAYFAQRWGKTASTPSEHAVEVAGALVDSTSVRELTAAIEAHRLENAEARYQMRRTVEMMGHFSAAIEGVGNEVEELRRAVGEMTREMARRR